MADALWLSKKEFLNFAENGWLRPEDYSGKTVYLEIGWGESFDESQTLTAELLQRWKIEEVLVAHGTEPDLVHWRDLANHAVVPLHLLVRPVEKIEAGELARKFEGFDDSRISFEFIPWGPSASEGFSVEEIRNLLSVFNVALPGFRLKTFSGQDVLDRQSEPDLEL